MNGPDKMFVQFIQFFLKRKQQEKAQNSAMFHFSDFLKTRNQLWFPRCIEDRNSDKPKRINGCNR